MKQDELFDEEKGYADSVLESAKVIGRNQLKSRFRKLDRGNKARRLNLYLIAASIAILIIATVFILKPSSEQQLYSTYYHKMPNKVISITRGNTEVNDLKLAFIAYEKSEYTNAKERFLALEDTSPEVKLYLGIIEMENANYNDALEIFIPLLDDPDYQFASEAKWYSALCKLKTSETAEARSFLVELKGDDSIYGVKASKLLEQI